MSTFKKLRGLMGYVENGSDVSITLSQDDATGTYHVTAKSSGKEIWSEYGDTLYKAIDKAYHAHAEKDE